MNEQTTGLTTRVSFKEFLFTERRHRLILYLSAAAIIIQFAIFKYFYPYASYIHGDSFVYLRTAYDNSDINTYMVGYSRFLRLFSVFTSSDLALTAFQYIFIQYGALFLLFTIFYFYKPGKITKYVLLAFMVFNPLFLHLANLVSSDCFFAALSLIWFSLLLWIIHSPSNRLITLQILMLLIAFTVRYNALIYPFFAGVAFCISTISLRKKVIGIGAGMVACGLFMFYTSYKYKQLTGIWQYSPFMGWQLTNNAMDAYRYVDSSDRKPVPKRFQAFDNMVREYYDSTGNFRKHPEALELAGTFYMWSPGLSMFKYRNKILKKDSAAPELKKWALMGPFYKQYGLYIISHYPATFVRYFIWPNAKKYFTPPVEFLENYNSGKDTVTNTAKLWFGYKTGKVATRTGNTKATSLTFYPVLTGTMNVVFFISLLYFIILNGLRNKTAFRQCIILVSIIWLANAGFTIFSSSVALRFQAFPILLITTFSLMLIDWMFQLLKSMKLLENKQKIKNAPFSEDAIAHA